MSGAAAGSALSTSAALGATVQIDLGDKVSDAGTSNGFDFDFTGDGNDDLSGIFSISTIINGSLTRYSTAGSTFVNAGVLNLKRVANVFEIDENSSFVRWIGSASVSTGNQSVAVNSGSLTGPFFRYFASAGYGGTPYATSFTETGPATAKVFYPVEFNDASINGGQTTQGLIEVCSTAAVNEACVEFVRLVFDNANPNRVPDDVDFGGTKPQFVPGATTGTPVDPNAALRLSLTNKLNRFKKQFKKARKSGNTAKVQKIKKKIKKVRIQLRRL